MKRKNFNISLTNLAEAENGLFLSLRKGINELLNRASSKASPKPFVLKGNFENILSVIVCTAGREELLKSAIASLLSQDFDTKLYEVIVVNNSKEPLLLDNPQRNLKIINEEREGLSYARNTGASFAKGEYLLFIDDDAVACDALLSNIYNSFLSHPDTAIIGGQIHLCVPTPAPKVFLKGKESIWSGYTVPYNNFREIREQYEFPYGACFAIRHSALDAFGGFPVNYGRVGNNFAGGEETALCFLAKNMGLKIGIEPKAEVLHMVSEDRFTKEHIAKTIRAGIFTTHRLFLEGYAKSGWTLSYINERINIINHEINKLEKNKKALPLLYKKCELDAFIELKETYFKQIQ